MTEAAARVLRVTELNRYIKYVLEADDRLTALHVVGEVSNLSRSPSGHIYFSLKDGTSQIPCVFFRREVMRQPAEARDLRNGTALRVAGSLTVYEPRGSVQIYVEQITLVGEGEMARRVEALRVRLEAEGLFSADRKRPLPSYPRSIALLTSPGSQAYHDVLHRLRTQYPLIRVIVAGASVQGEGAADEMAFAIDIVNRLTDADLILLVRGGGAPEELAAFNEERLARAIFASRVPVVTGVGHEMDNSIADLVADFRAATPSLAAAAAVPDLRTLVAHIHALHSRAGDLTRARVRSHRHRLESAQRLLLQCSPRARLQLRRQRTDELAAALVQTVTLQVRGRRVALESLRARLNALDPLAILSRGYAVVTDLNTNRVVTAAADLAPGGRIEVRVADGLFTARVEDT